MGKGFIRTKSETGCKNSFEYNVVEQIGTLNISGGKCTNVHAHKMHIKWLYTHFVKLLFSKCNLHLFVYYDELFVNKQMGSNLLSVILICYREHHYGLMCDKFADISRDLGLSPAHIAWKTLISCHVLILAACSPSNQHIHCIKSYLGISRPNKFNFIMIYMLTVKRFQELWHSCIM